jgi:hypothetical protein
MYIAFVICRKRLLLFAQKPLSFRYFRNAVVYKSILVFFCLRPFGENGPRFPRRIEIPFFIQFQHVLSYGRWSKNLAK